MSPPSSEPNNKPSKKQRELLFANCLMLVSCLAYSSAPKMKATYFSETSIDFERITRRYITED
jgi:hypothetical protein